MLILLISLMLILNLTALRLFKKLRLLRSISQIQAEVELEMHSRAHRLLVERDKLEVGLVKHAVADADEKWKGDLAEYMEEFEQEALLRVKQRLPRG
ncbi:MAG: hypothetical protein KKE08_07575 [Gammaproteobacteria bacterium]|nr:hypothetical protein [Gammaproteobacteria bacterium]MBU2182867.1 hypothetical protein [Gammaproteobacteria bacterium]MBU2203487.1 hypothetical protein [Gammaproteobacteria bacterium]